mmetsp:Transcript_3292/g.4498  ORF Transcript_3292/g.4498 Transcript_3292/m.4498 type:complete len:156 (+) Transcript_3292:237-704(+)
MGDKKRSKTTSDVPDSEFERDREEVMARLSVFDDPFFEHFQKKDEGHGQDGIKTDNQNILGDTSKSNGADNDRRDHTVVINDSNVETSHEDAFKRLSQHCESYSRIEIWAENFLRNGGSSKTPFNSLGRIQTYEEIEEESMKKTKNFLLSRGIDI